jgi:antitoxin HicB
MKLAVYQAMRDQKIGKAELARRLGCHLPQVDRILDLRHSSKIEQVEAALNALGLAVRIEVEKAA